MGAGRLFHPPPFLFIRACINKGPSAAVLTQFVPSINQQIYNLQSFPFPYDMLSLNESSHSLKASSRARNLQPIL